MYLVSFWGYKKYKPYFMCLCSVPEVRDKGPSRATARSAALAAERLGLATALIEGSIGSPQLAEFFLASISITKP